MNPDLKILHGFSKLEEGDKLRLISDLVTDPEEFRNELLAHKHSDPEVQDRYQHLSENTLSNHHLPFGVAPNFMINNRIYHLPMVIEESSVVAAAAAAAKFWLDKGGFNARIIGKEKKGQVHFISTSDQKELDAFLSIKMDSLLQGLSATTKSMNARGGGITSISLLHKPEILPGYYQLDIGFDTKDSMGANFINSCLEELAKVWSSITAGAGIDCEIVMSILSNYTPDCLVECRVETPVENMLSHGKEYGSPEFAERFLKAFDIAHGDVSRAVTHNKGIFNGIDAVVIATGNDFRAVEANGHAYASRDGRYRSLSEARIEDGVFSLILTLPVNIGTVGGVTAVHPMAKRALEILGQPTSDELMQIIAAAGLASNFSAVKALVSGGIQEGHMRLHLSNILAQLKANSEETIKVNELLYGKTVSFASAKEALEMVRKNKND